MTYAPPRPGCARRRQDAAYDGPWPPAVRAALRAGGATGRRQRHLRAQVAENALACARLRRVLATWRRARPEAPAPAHATAAALTVELQRCRTRALVARDSLFREGDDDG